MSTADTQNHKPSIGDEIPYRRSEHDKGTGSLVFDQHRHEKTAEVTEMSPEEDMPKSENPLKRGQVT